LKDGSGHVVASLIKEATGKIAVRNERGETIAEYSADLFEKLEKENTISSWLIDRYIRSQQE